jgi:hypothetical protein
MGAETLVYVFHDKTLYKFERAERHTASWLGGPPPREISGQPFGPQPLHQIACIGNLHIRALGAHRLTELPLIYGMCYDGCELSYRVESSYQIEMLHIDPPSSRDDWPYSNFPPLIPYVPLRLEDTPRSESYDGFVQRFPNMPWPQPTELVIAVPPPATIGLSFWAGGDGDDVTIVFECDLKERKVRAFNRTS